MQENIIGYQSIGEDITELKQAAERLKQEQSEKELILRNLAEQVALIDPEMHIIWANSKVIERITSAMIAIKLSHP